MGSFTSCFSHVMVLSHIMVFAHRWMPHQYHTIQALTIHIPREHPPTLHSKEISPPRHHWAQQFGVPAGAEMLKPEVLRTLDIWNQTPLPRHSPAVEEMIISPIHQENFGNILLAALLRPSARTWMSKHYGRSEDCMLAAAYTLDIWTEQWKAGVPLLPPCQTCGLPTGNWCDTCDSPTLPLCTACEDLSRCRNCAS